MRLEMVNKNFKELNEREIQETNGGSLLVIAVVATVCFVGGIVANEVVERKTGSDIATHVGNTISSLGKGLYEWGKNVLD